MKPFPRLTRDEEERATAIHLEAFVIDGLTVSSHSRQQFSKMIQGGVNAANWTIAEPEHDFRQCIHDITSWYSLLRSNEDKTTFVVTARDILQAKKEKKVGIIFGLQNAKPIGDEIGILQVLHRLGLRIIQLTYNERNFIGDGAGEKTDCGLSSFGERVVEEMNRLGISSISLTVEVERVLRPSSCQRIRWFSRMPAQEDSATALAIRAMKN